MRIEATRLAGVHVVDSQPIYDERGFVARVYDREVFRRLGIDAELGRTTISHNRLLGTLRGLHWRPAPEPEARLVRVPRGSAYEVVVDLREGSRTFGCWVGIELSAANARALFIPPQCAHGFMTLEDDTEVSSQCSSVLEGERRTLRWDDPDVAIEWPLAPRVISRRDAESRGRLADLVISQVA